MISTIPTTTTTTDGMTTTTGVTTTTTGVTETVPTTTLVLGADLLNTGPEFLFPTLFGGIGMRLLGAGVVALAPKHHPRFETY